MRIQGIVILHCIVLVFITLSRSQSAQRTIRKFYYFTAWWRNNEKYLELLKIFGILRQEITSSGSGLLKRTHFGAVWNSLLDE